MNPPEAIHKRFFIPDIAYLLCELVNSDADIRLRTLARLARTCRIFRDPALNFLWSEQDGLVHLIKCFPSDLWTVSGSTYLILRAITVADWPNFLGYSQRIKTLVMGSRHEYVSAEAYRALSTAASTTSQVLFPNLTELRWFTFPFPSIEMYLGPSLSTFCFGPSDTILDLLLLVQSLTTIAIRYPSLKSFTFFYPLRSDSRHIETLTTAICSWNQLRTLRVGNHLGEEGFRHIAKLSHLEDLCFTWPSSNGTLPRPQVDHRWFPALNTLDMACHSLDSCIDMIQLMHASNVSTLKMSVIENTTGKQHATSMPFTTTTRWNRLFQMLEDCCVHVTLSFISFESRDIFSRIDPAVTIESIRHIFVFRHLNHVRIETGGGCDIDDVNMKELAEAWPCLTFLSLQPGTQFGAELQPRLTLASLVILATNCPNLQFLSLAIDARSVSVAQPESGDARIKHTKRLELAFRNPSPINNTDGVASFLATLFPEAVVVGTSLLGGDSWRSVASKVKIINKLSVERAGVFHL
ncbi:hypothetical protein Hypma_007445 [Hypsizygus marmoreus]|uniref:F-box domain-containing protein n=1 Tax=Hypsizygus marmoreus TaxID=39966 RepID=A0A369JUC9_HYPMA|nr:hypothetical protein Hypma_007445 [Hypsizygus marmoreus]